MSLNVYDFKSQFLFKRNILVFFSFYVFKTLYMHNQYLQGVFCYNLFVNQKNRIPNYAHDYKINVKTRIKIL